MVQPYGFASRQEGNCTTSIECGQTFDDTHKWCCPTGSTCQSNDYDRVCCDSTSSFAVCLNTYIGSPVCATSSYTLYDNAGKQDYLTRWAFLTTQVISVAILSLSACVSFAETRFIRIAELAQGLQSRMPLFSSLLHHQVRTSGHELRSS